MRSSTTNCLITSFPVLALVVLIAGCGVGASSSTTKTTTNVTGEDEESYSTDISFHGSGAEAQLEQANALARDRDFAGAMEIYRELHDDPEVDAEIREECLLRLGESQGAMFNPHKNYSLAIATLEEFLANYPESSFAGEAEESLERFESIEAQLQNGE